MAAAKQLLEHGRSAEGATEIRHRIDEHSGPATFDQVLHLAFEFNLVDLARHLAQEGTFRYPRDAKLKRWAEVLAPPVVRPVSRSVMRGRNRQEETTWLRENAHQYRGMWVVVLGRELLVARKSLKAAIRQVRDRLPDAPLVHFVRP